MYRNHAGTEYVAAGNEHDRKFTEREREGGGERESDREREKDRQTDRQTERETDKQTDI